MTGNMVHKPGSVTTSESARGPVAGCRGWPASFISRRSAAQIQFLGRVVGEGVYLLSRSRRLITCRNLRFVHPEWSGRRIRTFSREVFHHFGITLIEMLQMAGLSRKECRDRIRIRGEEHLERALNEGRGIIIISAHLGNWETALQLYPLFFEKSMVGVAKPFGPAVVDQWVHRFRSRFGNRILYTKGALREMTRTLREGNAVGIMIDMARNKHGIPVRFFGREVSATPAAALLALRCKSPVIPVFCVRDPDGGLTVQAEPPVPIRKTSNFRDDLQFNTQVMTDVVERAVGRNPQQWYWMQKRWKTFFPELYPEYFAARKRRKARKQALKDGAIRQPDRPS